MNREERSLVVPITLGSLFEWYEVYLYYYWAPLFSKSLYDLSIPFAEFIYVIMILSVGLIARPLGGIIFGYIGDRWGRRKAFLISIVAITIPSIGVAIMPTFDSWAHFSLVYVGLMRFLQGVPAGGELPGALCLLSEGVEPDRKRYICSYLFIGPQIGQVLSMLQCYGLEQFLTHEQLIDWGWRLSFWIAGGIGLLGFILRRRLRESKSFEKLKMHHEIEYNPLKKSLKNYKKAIFLGFTLSIFEVVGFFSIYFYLIRDINIFTNNEKSTFWLNLGMLISIIIIMPIFGLIKNKYNNIKLLKISATSSIFASTLLFLSLSESKNIISYILLFILVIILCIQFSILPSFIAELYPTAVRFTCIGFSFNVADGVIGGLIPYLGYELTNVLNNQSSGILLLPVSALIFLYFSKFLKIKQRST